MTVNGPADEPPVRVVCCGLQASLSSRFRAAERVPEAVGLRVMSISHSELLGTLLPHVLLEMANSPAFAPVMVALLILRALPGSALKTLTLSVWLVACNATTPKLIVCGERTANVLQDERLTTCGFKNPVGSVISRAPGDGPPLPLVQSTPSVHWLPDARVAGLAGQLLLLLLMANGPKLEMATDCGELSLLVNVTVCSGGASPI